MLDIHIIINPETRPDWVGKCLRSIIVASRRAGYPVDTHIAPFVAGHIGRSRAAAYAMGSHKYVTCVDDDDWLEPDAFVPLLEPMQRGVPAIYTREVAWQNGKPTKPDLRQHMRVFRRDVLENFDFEAWPALESTATISHADTFGPYVQLASRGYNYRVRPESSAKKIAYGTSGLMDRARALGEVHAR